MKRSRRFAVLFLVLGVTLSSARTALAHPLGNFSINHSVALAIGAGEITLDYVLDMAEIPAFQEIRAIDEDRSDGVDPGEASSYHPEQCRSLASGLDLKIDGSSIPLQLVESSLELPPGAGNLKTLRLSCTYLASTVPAETPYSLGFDNKVYEDRPGWREILVTADGIGLQGEFAAESTTDRLRAYPDSSPGSPLDQRSLTIEVFPAGESVPASPQDNPATPADAPAGRDDPFTRLAAIPTLGPAAVLLALGIAFVWGALHALTPGHGKTLVGAYLVGSRGTPRHAIFLGLTTTLTHTAGVFLLGLATLFASRYIVADQLFPWLSLLSGILVVGIGINLLRQYGSRIRHRLALPRRMRSAGGYRVQSPSGQAVAASGSLLRNPAYRPIHSHSHGHGSGDDQNGHWHAHGDGQAHFHPHTPAHGSDRRESPAQAEPHHHDHGPGGHTHLPPGADGSTVTWRGLLALGVSGGLIPCPSALVVLLSAIALDRIGFGIVLVLAFSIGLAGVLTAIGLMLVFSRRFFNRFPEQARLALYLPAASALFITVAGVVISARALLQLAST
jgi:ABC-type nickel/cobalt efflux system permease component RcnA